MISTQNRTANLQEDLFLEKLSGTSNMYEKVGTFQYKYTQKFSFFFSLNFSKFK